MKVLIYGRTAFPPRVANRDSHLKRQLSKVRAFARRKGYKVAAEFSDSGVSGMTTRRRGLRRLLRYCEKDHDIRLILVEDVFKLSRKWPDSGDLLRTLKTMGIQIAEAA